MYETTWVTIWKWNLSQFAWRLFAGSKCNGQIKRDVNLILGTRLPRADDNSIDYVLGDDLFQMASECYVNSTSANIKAFRLWYRDISGKLRQDNDCWRSVAIVSAMISVPWQSKGPGPWFNIKMSSYQYRKSHCGDKTVVRSSYLNNGISYTGKTASLYWVGAQDASSSCIYPILHEDSHLVTRAPIH